MTTVPALTWAPWPHYDSDEIDAVGEILSSGRVNYWTGGVGRRFEESYAEHLGRRHAVALANGTVALELALIAHGIGPGDEVVTTPRTFIASASAAVVCGATPVLADVDRDSGNVTAATIEAVLTDRTRAVVVVHLAGWPAEMAPIMALAKERGLLVIEDCAQAHGATYRGRPVGAFGDVAAFSFCQDKIITTGGEGGLIALDDEAAWERAWAYKDHGKSYDAVYRREHPPGYRWLHESFGTNWRLTEMQAAIGAIQLAKLPRWSAARRHHAGIWRRHLTPLEALRVPEPPAHTEHAYYKFYAYLRPERLAPGWDRERIQLELEGSGVPVRVGSCSEIYRERAFVESELGPSQPLPVAHELGETSLMFPVHPTLDERTLEAAGEIVGQVVRRATR